jgi:hypothetical protein
LPWFLSFRQAYCCLGSSELCCRWNTECLWNRYVEIWNSSIFNIWCYCIWWGKRIINSQNLSFHNGHYLYCNCMIIVIDIDQLPGVIALVLKVLLTWKLVLEPFLV